MQTNAGQAQEGDAKLDEHLTCRVPCGTLAKLNQAADRQGTERSQLVRQIVLKSAELAL